ncbi:MAG: trypsin-like serine peptidase [Bdellovibrionia bacterium]
MKLFRFVLVLVLSFTAACSDNWLVKNNLTKNIKEQVTYGEDSRQEASQIVGEKLIQQASATLALVHVDKIFSEEGPELALIQTLQKDSKVCSDEAFSQQVSLAHCTATLIDSDLMLTAAHCFPMESSCEETKIIPQYTLDRFNAEHEQSIELAETYSCKSVEYLQLPETGADFAFVRLDRKVVGVEPVDIKESREVQAGEELYNFSFPAGLPLKMSTGQVRSVELENHFLSEIDVFAGSSGSLVYGTADSKPLGILVSGENDFEYDESAQCFRTRKCANGECRGEKVLQLEAIHKVMDLIKNEHPVTY